MVVVGAADDADGILLAADDLGAAFFDPRSGHAGELFQKVTNDGLRLALVLPDAAAYGPRWPELAFEHARHRTIRFFTSAVAAEAWLRGGDGRPVRAAMRTAAGGKSLWIVGGGDLAGQFYDAGLLDDLIVQVGPLARATVATEAPWRRPSRTVS